MSKAKSFFILSLGLSLAIGLYIAVCKYGQKLNEKSRKIDALKLKEEASKKTLGELFKDCGIDIEEILEKKNDNN